MPETSNRKILLALGVVALFGITTIALAAATLGTMTKRLNDIENKLSSPTSTMPPPTNATLVTSMNIDEILQHLRELQNIADASGGTRAINTPGFNRTLDYISDTLAANTNFVVNKTFFSVRDFALNGTPIFISSINGVIKNYTYSSIPENAEFIQVKYSTPSSLSNVYEVTVIPNGGCAESDWGQASAPTLNRVALVKRGGNCAFADRAAQAPKFNVSGILFYNDGLLADRFAPLEVSLGQTNALPVLFLSYAAGQAIADALSASAVVTVQMGINLIDLPDFPVGNICADTLTGDATQTIVVGGHSDGVPAGPGINDNGSGSAAILGLAIALARLFQTSTYATYAYRVRFCWWGAEEVGLLGAKDHVQKAKNANAIAVGERISDYLINLNYDMLGSPNFIFGIYDGQTAPSTTPSQALEGSNKITTLFRNWFEQQNLPWNLTDFSGRSDYGPFLAEGIVAGGLFSGADGIRSQAERNYYGRMLGQGMGGIPGIAHDPCYHRDCDSIENVNKFGYEKMVHAAAYALEYLARQNDLRTWLYPN